MAGHSRGDGPDDSFDGAFDKAVNDERDDHPVGTVTGTGAGATAGAVVGMTVAGPPGAVVGGVVGGALGGRVGHAVAADVSPDDEDAYWRQHYADRPYVQAAEPYDTYAPAYRHGWESRRRHSERSWEESEAEIAGEWEAAGNRSPWEKVRDAVRDAWDRAASSGGRGAGPPA